MRYFISLLIGLLLLPLAAIASDIIPEDKIVIQFKGKRGVVTFNHHLHATLRVTECGSCHHTHEAGAPFQPCADCHKKKKKTKVPGFSVVAPKTSKAYHIKCKGCHKYTLEELEKPAGPTKCKLCHIK
jgi:hypothetical protein